MSFFDDLGAWLKKSLDDTGSFLGVNQQPAAQPQPIVQPQPQAQSPMPGNQMSRLQLPSQFSQGLQNITQPIQTQPQSQPGTIRISSAPIQPSPIARPQGAPNQPNYADPLQNFGDIAAPIAKWTQNSATSLVKGVVAGAASGIQEAGGAAAELGGQGLKLLPYSGPKNVGDSWINEGKNLMQNAQPNVDKSFVGQRPDDNSLAYGAGNLLGQVAPFVASAALSDGASVPETAPGLIKVAVPIAKALVSPAAISGAEGFESTLNTTGDQPNAGLRAVGDGLVQGALMSRLKPFDSLMTPEIDSALKNAAKSSAALGALGGSSQVAGNFFNNQPLLQNVPQAAAQGAVTGAMLSAPQIALRSTPELPQATNTTDTSTLAPSPRINDVPTSPSIANTQPSLQSEARPSFVLSETKAGNKLQVSVDPNTGHLVATQSAMNIPGSRDLQAEQFVQEGLRQNIQPADLVPQYMQSTGASSQKAMDDILRVARESGIETGSPAVNHREDVNMMPLAGQGNMVPLKRSEAKIIAENALNDGEGAITSVAQRGQLVSNAIKQGVARGEDHLFIDAIEHPESMDQILSTVKKPQEFQAAVDAWKNLTNHTHQAINASGEYLPFRNNYYTHILSDDSKAKLTKDIPEVAGHLNGKYYQQDRVFNDVRELRGAGLSLKNERVADDVNDYVNAVKSQLRRNTIVNSLKDNAPGHITTFENAQGRIPIDQNGQPFKQSRIPGMEKMLISPDIHAYLRNGEPVDFPIVIKAIDKVNSAVKQFMLGGGNFHNMVESIRFASQELASGRLPNVFEAEKIFASKKAYDAWRTNNLGVIDFAARSHLTLDKNTDLGTPDSLKLSNKASDNAKILLKKADAIRIDKKLIHEPLFERKINYYKLITFQKEMQRLKIDPATTDPDKLQIAKNIAYQVNNWYGGINSGLIAKSPIGKLLQRLGILAPDWTIGKANTIGNAIGGGRGARSLAVRQLTGNMIGLAIVIEAYNQMTGQGSKNWGDFLKNDVLDPSIKLPFKSPSGKGQVAKFPTSPVGDLYRAITDPSHFITSHSAALPSVGVELATGKDYFGNPLVDPFKNPNPTLADQALAIAQSKLPIPIRQGELSMQGKESPMTALINILGPRVTNDPDDPQVQAAKKYFDAINQAKSGLNPNQLADYNVVHQQKKDTQGNPVTQPTLYDPVAKAAIYLRDPAVLAADTNIALSDTSKPHDPFFDLTSAQQKIVLTREMLNAADPLNPTAKQMLNQNKGWLTQYEQARSTYFNGLNLQAGSSNQPIQRPQVTSDLQNKLSSFGQISDPKARAQFLKDNPDLSEYYNQMDQFYRTQRNALGEPQYKSYPQPDAKLQQTIDAYNALPKGTGARSNFIKQHPELPSYWSQIDQYNLTQDAQQAAFEGNNFSQKGLKAISGLAQDISKNSDGSYSLNAGNSGGGNGGHGGGGGRMSSSQHQRKQRVMMPHGTKIRVYRPSEPRTSSKFTIRARALRLSNAGRQPQTNIRPIKIDR